MKNPSCIRCVSLLAGLVVLLTPTFAQLVFGQSDIRPVLLVPMAQSEENIYLVWSSNATGNGETMFRASHNNGTTFAEPVNLSNSTSSDSINAQVMASGNNVFVTWWETNQTDDTPVLRVSNDNGETFGPLLKLATNDTLETVEGGIQY
jgi:hypothetical protein